MTRYIAILTLALTAALSADESFAQSITADVDHPGTLQWSRPSGEVTIDSLEVSMIRNPVEQSAIGIPAFIGYLAKRDPELAYLMLRDDGFTGREAMHVVEQVIFSLNFEEIKTTVRSEQRPDDRDD